MDKIDKRKRPYRKTYYCRRPDCPQKGIHNPHPVKTMPILKLPGSPFGR